ncbi:MAG TPA: hypothetical protein VER76_07805 [Pyrinomonadaceae bacterium]|nr:hypothetical protein [Pyrinomonadaceae bacterium]
MKVWRAFIAGLLLILFSTTGSGSSSLVARTSFAAQEADGDTRLTAEEEQEAISFAERFVRRMQETNDLAPLVGEMFVADYAARLHREALNKSLFLMNKSVAQQASPEELARYFVALNNCGYVVGLVVARYEEPHATSDDGGEGEGKFFRADLTGILDVLKNDPILASLFGAEQKEGAGENRPGEGVNKPYADEDDDEPIRTVEQLRHVTSTLEKASVLARRHLDALAVKPSYLESHKGANEEENWAAERDRMKPRVWMLNEEFYGYPKETRFLCVNVLLYHMDLIRVDGKLKILALYPDMD